METGVRRIYFTLVVLSHIFISNSFRVKDIDRKTSGKTGKDACTLSLAVDWDQFEQICPIRQLATLKKQISDAKRMIKNSTYLESNYQSRLESEREMREALTSRVEVLHSQVGNCQRELAVLRTALTNFSRLPERPEVTPASPILVMPTPDYTLQRLSLQRTKDLERRVIMLESKIKAFENIPMAKSCGDIRRWGIFPIRPEEAPAPFDVACMRDWTVIARRIDGSENFLRNWQDYKHGFGNISGDYWIGNDNIHYLTTQAKYRLRVDVKNWNGSETFSMYDTFWVEGEDEFYRLHVGNHSGPLQNAFYDSEDSPFNHDGMYFSTYDMDNDISEAHCAEVYSGGYWYNDCYASNLNGPYCSPDEEHSRCMIWWGDAGRMILRSMTMRIKEISDGT